MIERFAGRFALLKHLGRGGMGDVYLARDLTMGTECALKRMKPGAARASPDQMRREFEALARVRHPAVVAVHELGFGPDGAPYLTMEYVPGLAADRALRSGDWPALYFVATQLALGLEALHAEGVAHGDLKPSNLMVIPGPTPDAPPASVRLLDFGLAAVLGRADAGHRGTPGYAAPEVVRGAAPDVVSDLYGLGATLYTLACGQPPFEGKSASTLLRHQQAGPPPALPLEDAGVPAPLARLILRLMTPTRMERGRDVREVRRELERMHPAARRPLSERLENARVVGREREIAKLEAWFSDRSRRTRLQLLIGPPGIGKSELLRELAARAALAGRGVALVSCAAYPGSGGTARVLARRLAAEAGADPDQALSGGVRDRLAAADAPLVEEDLQALVEAAATWSRMLRERAGAPLVLLDDTERIDPVSSAFLRRLLLHAEDAPPHCIGARRGRADAPTDDERLLIEAGVAAVLPLRPLDPKRIETLASVRLGEPAPAALVDFLRARAGGDPGLAIELLRAAAAGGALVEDDQGVRVDASALEGLRAAESFESSLLARWQGLPEGARRAAAVLAALRRAAAPPEVQAVDRAADGQAITQLVAAGLAAPDSGGRLALAPPLLADRLLEALGPEATMALHVAVLALPGLSQAERFHHSCAAGRTREALAAANAAWEEHPDEILARDAAERAAVDAPEEEPLWRERAARALFDRGLYAKAIPQLERSLSAGSADAARHDRRLLLSTAHLRCGHAAEAGRVVAEALAENPPAVVRAGLLANESARLLFAGNSEEACRVATEALAVADGAGDDPARGVAALSLASALRSAGRMDEAGAMADRALDAYRRARHPLGTARARGVVAALAHASGQLDESERLYTEALGAAREGNLRLALEELLMSRAAVLVELGHFAPAREAASEALRISLEDGRALGAAVAMTNLAQIEGLMGESRPATRHARSAVRLTRRHIRYLEGLAWRSLAQGRRISGNLPGALRAAHLATSRPCPSPQEERWRRVELGRSLAARGRWDEIAALTREPAGDSPPDSAGALALGLLAARAALRRSEFAPAAARLAAVDRWLGTRPLRYSQALADQVRAELGLAQGRLAEGVASAKKALESFGGLPAPADRACAALEFARLGMSGDLESRAPIGSWLEEAAATFERLGDRMGRERSLVLMVRWLRRNSVGVAGVPRERDLIAAVSRLLNSLSDLHELAQRAMEIAVEQLDAERGVLLLSDPESGRLISMAEHGGVDASTRREAVGYSRRAVQRVADSGGSLLIGDAPSDPRALSESVVDLHLRSILCVPMFVGGRVVGAVYLDDSRRRDAFSEADRGLLEGFAHLMAVAIEKSRGHEEVQRANQILVGENLSLRQQVGARFQAQNLIGTSSEMRQVFATLELVANSDSSVLLTGENGTGKELIARTLHHSGKRRVGPFVAVNCGAIPETLLESELFGILAHVATDVRARDGRFVQADGGTLFLDEIGEMPLKQQVALLSAISNREITPVGGGKPISVNVRIIAATNRDLRKLIEGGVFREDLFYRLNVIPIEVPPLRDRKADIPALVHHFLGVVAQQQDRKAPDLSPDFMATVMQSDWPGNVRELQNYVERVLAMNPGRMVFPNPLPRDLELRSNAIRLPRGRRLSDLVSDLERRLIEEALVKTRGNQSLAARHLGLTEQSLRYRLRKYEPERAREKPRARRKQR